MSFENNKALVRREQEELWNHTGNLDAAEELFVPEQAEAARQEAADFRRGFPDVVSIIEDLIAEGNKVAARLEPRHPPGRVCGHPPDRQGGGVHGHLRVPHRGRQDRRVMDRRGRLGPDAPDRRRSRAGAIAVGQSRTPLSEPLPFASSSRSTRLA